MNTAGLRRLHHDDAGRSLPAVLVALAVGVLLIVPLLNGGSTSLLATRAADQALFEGFALDAGIEYAIWKLRYDPSFRASVDAVPTVPVAVTPAMSLNGYSPSITGTALAATGWQSLADTPATVRAGGALVFGGGDYLYAFRGGNRDFWRYSLSGNTWTAMAMTPTGNTGNGAALAWDGGGFIYATRGANQFAYWRYSIAANSWSTLTNTPARVSTGGSLAYTSGYVYALRGANQQDFWRYNVASGLWADRADTPDDVNNGGALVYAGANQFYALRGDGSPEFWRYSATSDAWTILADTPEDVHNGGALVYPGGDYIFAFRGDDTTDFWRYNILDDSWSSEATAPSTVRVGGSLAYAGGEYLYALRGDTSRDFWRHRATPPRYDLLAQSGSRSTYVRIEISGTNVEVLFWDVQ